MDVTALRPFSPIPSLLRGRIRLFALRDIGGDGKESFVDGSERFGEGSEKDDAALLSLPRGLDRRLEPVAESGGVSNGSEAALLLVSLRSREGVNESTEESLLFISELVRPSKPLEDSLGESGLGDVGADEAGLAVDGTGEAGFDDAVDSLSASFDAPPSRVVKRFFNLNMVDA